MDVKTLISAYSSEAWTRLLSFLPSFNSNSLANVLNFYTRTSRSRYRRWRSGFPLPLPSK
uniref:Uncharacterized protein n=1 Tax=Nelumbo nucifera TaxID=4432 RepID=A0A822XWC8_NELNU|nr:TPA_asm: hypothetical protein HUJ06_024769 [Nelumbo nucifera]